MIVIDECIHLSSSSLASIGDGLLNPPLLFLLFRLGVPDGLINGEDGASSLSGSLESIHLHQERLPDEGSLVITHTSCDIHTHIESLLIAFLIVVD